MLGQSKTLGESGHRQSGIDSLQVAHDSGMIVTGHSVDDGSDRSLVVL